MVLGVRVSEKKTGVVALLYLCMSPFQYKGCCGLRGLSGEESGETGRGREV